MSPTHDAWSGNPLWDLPAAELACPYCVAGWAHDDTVCLSWGPAATGVDAPQRVEG